MKLGGILGRTKYPTVFIYLSCRIELLRLVSSWEEFFFILSVDEKNISFSASAANTDLAILEPKIKGRELFASESTDIYPATFIK